MAMLDLSDVTNENDLHGTPRTKPGRYHVAVLNAEETASKKKGSPGIEIEFQVLYEGIGPDKKPTIAQKNSTIRSFINLTGSDAEKTKTCLRNAALLAVACGIMYPGERKEPDWSEAIGRELIIEVKASKYESNGQEIQGSEVSMFGYWTLGNEQVADVPKDTTTPGMLQLAKTSGNGQSKLPSTPAPLPPTANLPQSTASKFASLL
jgi:hypothetical protein